MNLTNTKARLLLVEDDRRLARLIQLYLTEQGYFVHWESHGSRVLVLAQELQPDLIILDLMLPDTDGFTLCRQLGEHYQGPVLILSALGNSRDQIQGLNLGAADYVVKPVEPELLKARIDNLLRRQQQLTAKPSKLHFGQLVINGDTRTVQLQELEVNLTSNEFALLWTLATQAGKVLSRDYLYQTLLGFAYDGTDRKLDQRVSRLRKKLGDDSDVPTRIKTIWGHGYLFAPDSWL
ncbi:response regulator transcription factor [Gallaecimonas xiamenensis]|uniref:Two component transcriptional regulator n=1 Tax=Gallaecimonas xiamenensis 3-C-1 TaxID=745411 RepID=K2J276_9GAMM|nr:response regulator transcription factor [Gallaecimonas xiamenensis]EKE77081.1 two component transcriptional regulator [Gallaecimonas xiamenensis 3-C-1]